jgi:hypothetical protein
MRFTAFTAFIAYDDVGRGFAFSKPRTAASFSRTSPSPPRASQHRRSYGRRTGLEDAADHDAVGKHVEIIVLPIAGWPVCFSAFEKECGQDALQFIGVRIQTRSDCWRR